MSRFIGLDVHAQSCTAVVMTQAGKRPRRQVMETDAGVLSDFVRSVKRPRYLCMEEGTQCAWLYEVLEPLVDELVVVQPPREPGHKSDGDDAWKCANWLRIGDRRCQVYKAPNKHRELRQAVVTYGVVQKDMVRVKNRLRATGRERGLSEQACQLYNPSKRHEVLAQLPEHHRHRAQIWCNELDMLVDCYEQAEGWLHDVAKRTPVVARLRTAPGIGVIRAAQIVAYVVTPYRFRTKRQFWSYCGLGVVTRATSEWAQDRRGDWVRKRNAVQTRGLNRNRHPVLKCAFKGAAVDVASKMKAHVLHQHYENLLEKGTKPNLATLTIARRIAAAVLAMWKANEEYDPDKHQRR